MAHTENIIVERGTFNFKGLSQNLQDDCITLQHQLLNHKKIIAEPLDIFVSWLRYSTKLKSLWVPVVKTGNLSYQLNNILEEMVVEKPR